MSQGAAQGAGKSIEESSADSLSAVSPIGNRRASLSRRRDAGCQPAKQQIINLCYENREGAGRSFLFRFARDRDAYRSLLHQHLGRFDVALLDY